MSLRGWLALGMAVCGPGTKARPVRVEPDVVNTLAEGRYLQKRRLLVADSVRRVSVEFTAPERRYSRNMAAAGGAGKVDLSRNN